MPLLNVVAGQFLTERGGGAVLVLGLVEHGNSGVQRSADDEVLLPGDLVGRVSLRLGAGAEADARDAVAALDGNAVGGEGPLDRRGSTLPLHREPDACRPTAHGAHQQEPARAARIPC